MKTAQQIAQEWQAQMNDHRIKCPRCGSSAQVERIHEDRNPNWKQKKDVYECGCGQRFEIIFYMTGYNLLKDEG